MAELADALDLGSSGWPCRFKSCYPHHEKEGARPSLFFVVCVSNFNPQMQVHPLILSCRYSTYWRKYSLYIWWAQSHSDWGCSTCPVTRTKKGKGKFVFPFFFFKSDRAWSRSGSEWQSGGLSEPRTTKPRSPRRESSPVEVERKWKRFLFYFRTVVSEIAFPLSEEKGVTYNSKNISA